MTEIKRKENFSRSTGNSADVSTRRGFPLCLFLGHMVYCPYRYAAAPSGLVHENQFFPTDMSPFGAGSENQFFPTDIHAPFGAIILNLFVFPPLRLIFFLRPPQFAPVRDRGFCFNSFSPGCRAFGDNL